MLHFEYQQPDSLAGVFSILARNQAETALLAGGTALMVDIHQGRLQPRHVVSLWGVPGLQDIVGQRENPILIGALCTVTRLVDRFNANRYFRALAEAGLLLGSRQIQNVATLGGNICKASPAADLLPPLLCSDATVLLSGPVGSREVALESFVTGPGRVDKRTDEVLTAVRLPAPPMRSSTAFLKIMRRKAEDLSIVAVAARIVIAEDGRTVADCRIGLGAVAPFPFRARRAEEILTGMALDPERLGRAAEEARDEARPISDVRASADYRRNMIAVLVRRAVTIAAARAMEGENRA
jgi:aerobic carbon-monoxide dehydrogenase medium subunit